MLLGMDWLNLHRTKVDCYDKAIECLGDNGKSIILNGKRKPTAIRMVTTMWTKKYYRIWCVMFAVHVFSEKGKDVEDAKIFKRYLVLK